MKTVTKIKTFALWFLLSLFIGVMCGTIGAAFANTIELVTQIRTAHSWILYLLPIGGIMIVLIYQLLRTNGIGTLNVFDAAKNNTPLPHGLSLAIFISSAISHLCGASVGREGAALQIGGGIASVLSRLFGLNKNSRRVIILCGMAALFSALFGTPLAAAVFVIEIIFTRICFIGAIPIFISSITAFKIATLLGVHPERFSIGNLPKFSSGVVLKILVIVIACVVVAFMWCKGLSLADRYSKKLFKNQFLRVAVGGVIIVIITLLIGNNDYNGGGVNVITRVFDESLVRYEAFALKLIFTVISVSSGYKGGEIVPTLFIGATLGGALAVLLDLPIGICAAIGIAALFCCSTKCPLASLLLCCEMFGFKCVLIILPIIIITTLLSHTYKGLYNNSNHIINFIYIDVLKSYRNKIT